MPLIDNINGIKIHAYNGEHRPPHIHADYNEYEVLIEIESKKIYAGFLPARQLKQVLVWLSDNESWALEVFYQLNSELK
jgi:hypothetical protein